MVEKAFEPDDPMTLVGVGLPDGDADLLATCLVEEFVRLGMSDAQLLALFRNPFYAGAHAIYRARGEEYVSGLIARVREQWGYPRFTTHESRYPSGVAASSAGSARAMPGGGFGRGAKPPSEESEA